MNLSYNKYVEFSTNGVIFLRKYSEILKKCPLFNGIDEQDLFKMLECLNAKVISFDKKYTIFAEGSKADHIGIMLSGSAQTVQVDYYGNRSILGNINASEEFAEAFACAKFDLLPVSIVATEPCTVMIIDRDRILNACENGCDFHRRLVFNLMQSLAQKTVMLHRKIEIISKRTTKEKLMAYLMLYAKRTGSNSFDIPFDRQQLADYLEVDRSGLSAEIGKLQKEGVLKSRKNHFELPGKPIRQA